MNDKNIGHPGTRHTLYVNGLTSTQTISNVYTDVVNTTPNDGKNPGDFKTPNGWAYTVDRSKKHHGMQTSYYNSKFDRITSYTVGSIGNNVKTDTVVWSDVRTMLWNQTLSKINERVLRESDWAEDLATLNRTKRLARLCDTAEDLARKLTKSPIRAIGAISSGYLYFRYGWMPLLSNIYDTASQQLNQVEKDGFRIKAGSRQQLSYAGRIVNTAVGSTSPVVNHSAQGFAACSMKIWVTGRPGMNLSNYTTLNPLYLGWNLVPYSFVVDWFYDVGGYLRAAEQAMKFNPVFKKGYASELFRCDYDEHAQEFLSGTARITNYTAGYHNKTAFQRTKFVSWPLPRTPKLNLDLGSSKLLAAAALLGAILGRK